MHVSLKLHLALTSEQVYIFEEMRDQALNSDPVGAAGCPANAP